MRDIKFNDITEVEGQLFFDQAIDLLLLVEKGEIPHDPDFGSTINDYIDQAQTVALPGIISSAAEAIDGKIPGVEILSISALNADEIITGSLPVSIEWAYSE